MLNTQYPAALVVSVVVVAVDVAGIPDDISRVASARVKTKCRIK